MDERSSKPNKKRRRTNEELLAGKEDHINFNNKMYNKTTPTLKIRETSRSRKSSNTKNRKYNEASGFMAIYNENKTAYITYPFKIKDGVINIQYTTFRNGSTSTAFPLQLGNLNSDILLVPDSNTIMSDYRSFKNIKHLKTNGSVAVCFIIAYIVWQEIDYIIHKKKFESQEDYDKMWLARRARAEIDRIALDRKINIFFEDYLEAIDLIKRTKTSRSNNDDLLLNYCIYLRRKHETANVILITNDILFGVKARDMAHLSSMSMEAFLKC